MSWQSGGCELLNGFQTDGPPVPQPPAGQEWPGIAGLAKWSATSDVAALEGIRGRGVPEGASFGCRLDLRTDEIGAGETITAEAVFSARLSDGVPAPSGVYRIEYAFPYLAREPANQLELEPRPRPIVLHLDLAVEGPPFVELRSTVAIDSALRDPRVAAWLDEVLLPELNGADIWYDDGRWRFTIKVAGDKETVVLVDATTGRVVDVQLADDPA